MKKILLIISLFPIAILAIFFAWSLLTRAQSAAGIVNGQLTPCPDKPNCVCSEFPEDAAHTIAAFQLPEGGGEESLAVMKQIIESLGGKIQNSDQTYLAATFSTNFFRFTDDVEIRLDADAGLLHMRVCLRARVTCKIVLRYVSFTVSVAVVCVYVVL